MKTLVRASAPGKVIPFGEHFVVYGEPAIVLAIDKRATVTAELRTDKKMWIKSKTLRVSGYFLRDQFHAEEGGTAARERLEPVYAIMRSLSDLSAKDAGVSIMIESSIPVAAGLGSSAAVAVASAAALSRLLDAELTKDEIFKTALEAERIVHRTPSGTDPAISTYGGIPLCRKDEDIKPLRNEVDLPLIIGDAGKERSTGEMVSKVKEVKKRYPYITDKIMGAGGEIVTRGIESLEAGDLETLGELMNINHALLYALGVSNEQLEKLVYAARKAGALGAKLTGAGGGGCIISLAGSDKLEDVENAIEQSGGKAIITRKATEGVRIE